jgi:acyl-coenzyme A thioesterase PaaI-like protein
VTLRLPPPLERPLAADRIDGRGALLRDGDAVVAEARAIAECELQIPNPVAVEEAEAARRASPLHREHPFPGCFVCGPERRPGDGLGIVCGQARDELVAAPWRVDGSLPTENGTVAPEILWAALDCPGGLAGILQPDPGVLVLGRLAAQIDGPVRPGTICVAIGWPIDRDGRKFHAGSAIFSGEGELLAHARATWIELKG